MQIAIGEAVRNRIIGAFGHEGSEWLEGIQATVDQVASDWKLHGLVQGGELSYSWIGFCSSSFGEACLKLSVPNHESLAEIASLYAFGESGVTARLFLTQPRLSAVLEEQIVPGRSAWSLSPDDRATIAGDLMRRLHAKPPAPGEIEFVPRVADQADRAFARARRDGVPEALLRAIELIEEVVEKSRSECRLIHGDLHHANMLLGTEWRIIDPKGIAAPHWMEPARFILNELEVTGESDRFDVWQMLVRTLADTTCTRAEEVAEGSGLDAVLSTCWSVEESIPQVASELEARSELALRIAEWATSYASSAF